MSTYMWVCMNVCMYVCIVCLFFIHARACDACRVCRVYARAHTYIYAYTHASSGLQDQ